MKGAVLPRYPEKHNCRITLTAPISRLVSQYCPVEVFLSFLLDGQFDRAGRTHKFNTSEIESNEAIALGLPFIQGDVTWRRKTQSWQLDVNKASFGNATWEEQIAGSLCEGALLVKGKLPESILLTLPGKPVGDIISHNAFGSDCIIHSAISWPGAPPGPLTKGRLDQTKIYVSCERIEYHA